MILPEFIGQVADTKIQNTKVMCNVEINKEDVWISMKSILVRTRIVFLPLVIIMTVITLTACGESRPVVNVKLELKSSSEVKYEAINEDGSMTALTKAPALDDADIYIADVKNFSASTESGKVVNKLISTVVTDNDGNEVEADEASGRLLQTIADSIQHDILEAKIFKDGQIYYIAVQTNVNWQSPCDFYQYNPSDGKLKSLCSWDDVSVLGVARVK